MHSFDKPFATLGEQARLQSCIDTLAQAPEGQDDLWLFGYGSLLWDAPFPDRAAVAARLVGWRRAMCVWTALARGTPEVPGLSLGLMPGGSCQGMAFQIGAADRDEALPMIWRREMWTDVYVPTWIGMEINGIETPALTFVSNKASRQYAGDLRQEYIVEHIALACGERGSCRDYLANTVLKLRDLGMADCYLEKLNDAVSQHR